MTKRGEPATAAAARLGMSVSTAFRWVRGFVGDREVPSDGATARAASRPTFVELVPASGREARLVVRVGGAEIEVEAGFDAVLLRAVVAALAGDAP